MVRKRKYTKKMGGRSETSEEASEIEKKMYDSNIENRKFRKKNRYGFEGDVSKFIPVGYKDLLTAIPGDYDTKKNRNVSGARDMYLKKYLRILKDTHKNNKAASRLQALHRGHRVRKNNKLPSIFPVSSAKLFSDSIFRVAEEKKGDILNIIGEYVYEIKLFGYSFTLSYKIKTDKLLDVYLKVTGTRLEKWVDPEHHFKGNIESIVDGNEVHFEDIEYEQINKNEYEMNNTFKAFMDDLVTAIIQNNPRLARLMGLDPLDFQNTFTIYGNTLQIRYIWANEPDDIFSKNLNKRIIGSKKYSKKKHKKPKKHRKPKKTINKKKKIAKSSK
jgi:hypothetical protein